MLNQARRANRKIRPVPMYKFGIQVPHDAAEAIRLDEKNGNKKWQDCMKVEIETLNMYNTFKDMGKIKHVEGHSKIPVRFVFDVKHDLRHRARLVAGGHRTEKTMEGTYSSVVSLKSIRIALLAAELNGLDVMCGDISSAYLEAKCREKVYFIAGPEFGELEGHLLIIYKALYGLRSAGASWHRKLADVLRDMGYFPCKADPDVWMKDMGTHYSYVCVYVDDLMHISKNPREFFEALEKKYGFHLKGVGLPEYHLGGDFFRDKDGTLCWGTRTYIKKMMMAYEKMFGGKPKRYFIPLADGDHPELDNSELLDQDGIRKYQSLIGALQWAVTLGRFDIHVAVTTMSSFRVAPRVGHMGRLHRLYGYLRQYLDAGIRIRTGIPDHESMFEVKTYEWMDSVYGRGEEDIPQDMPIPRGKPVRTTTFGDANLMHDLTTGRSMSGILHMVNQTPVMWFSKKQNTVETATYGSEFTVARQATEQIMDLRYTIRMMGIPLDGPAWMFGDNQSVITSSTLPHSRLNKRHNALSYHRVREAIASGVMYFIYIKSEHNPADALTKFLNGEKLRKCIEPLLFWKGETAA